MIRNWVAENCKPKGPLMLQDHHNAVRHRNIWMRRLKGYDGQ